MKKWIGLLVSLLMVLSVCMPAYAQENENMDVKTTITYGQSEALSMLKMMNDWRNAGTWYYQKDGSKADTGALPSLSYDDELESIAMTRAKQIAILFAHQQPDGQDIFALSNRLHGENIAAGTGINAAEAFEMWKEEDQPFDGQGHRRNMLATDFQSVGIGHVTINGVDCWVQDFSAFPSQSEMKSAARDDTVTETLSIPKSQIAGLTLNNYYGGQVYSGSSLPLPEIKAFLTFKDGVTALPVEATTSWQVNAELGHVEGSTLIVNANLGNREATVQAQAAFGDYTASQDVSLSVRCSHEKTHFVNQGAYHDKVCDICGETIGYQSHEWDEGKITKEATEDQEGVRTYTCKDCGATKTEAIAKLPKIVVKETSSDNPSPAPAAASTITQKQADTSVNNTVTSSVKSKAVTKPVTGKAYTTSTKKTVIGKKNITLKAPEKGQVKWQISNKKVATVSKGKVKIKGYGTVKIEAKVNGHTYTYILNVKKPTLKVNKKKITLKKGKSLKIKAQSNGKVKWTSQNKKIAKVSQGKITGIKKGSTTVIASSSGVKVRIKVTVK